MNLRRHLRAWAALSLLLQSAWLFALVPRDCCAAHTAPAAQSCHEEVAPPPHCPMMSGDGAACPMHQTAATHPAQDDCSMRGTCSGPMGALLSLLSAQAILADGPRSVSQPAETVRLSSSRERLVTLFVPPDSPPPRI